MTKQHLQEKYLQRYDSHVVPPRLSNKDIYHLIVTDALSELYELPKEAITPEMFDFLKIVSNGAKKYALNNWLDPNGVKCSESDMHNSMFHHLAESYSGFRDDEDSGLDPLLHLACRALMLYTRRQRGIKHETE